MNIQASAAAAVAIWARERPGRRSWATYTCTCALPTDSGFNTSSKANDDLAELAAVLQIAVHFHHIVELEYTIDDRLESAARKAPGDVLHRDLPACLVARDQPDAVPLDRWHLPDHLQHRYRSVTLAQGAVDVGDALIGQRGDQLGKVGAAYGVEGDLHDESYSGGD